MKSHNTRAPQPRAENVFQFPQGAPLPDLAKNISAFGERWWKLQQEGFRFMGERFEDNMKALQRMSACRTLPDVLAAQQKWFAETTQAYGEEWSRCANMMTEALHADADDDREGSQRNH